LPVDGWPKTQRDGVTAVEKHGKKHQGIAEIDLQTGEL
jgi:hypothetical protein